MEIKITGAIYDGIEPAINGGYLSLIGQASSLLLFTE
jgi:hypothetical protein